MSPVSGAPGGENPWMAFAKYAGIGFEVAITVVVSIYVGARLDTKFNSSPLFLIICLVAGFAVALNILIKYSRMAGKDMESGNGDIGRDN